MIKNLQLIILNLLILILLCGCNKEDKKTMVVPTQAPIYNGVIGKDAYHITLLPDEILKDFTNSHEFIIDTSGTNFAFWSEEPLTNLKIQEIIFSDEEPTYNELYHLDSCSNEDVLNITLNIPEGIPCYYLSFFDSKGNECKYYPFFSGKDGTLLLNEYKE